MSRTKEFSQREAMLPRAALGDSGLPPSTPACVLRKEGPGLTASEPGAVSDNTTSRSFAGQRVIAVSAGAYPHSLALTADGAVFTWGNGEDACLGHGEDLSNQLLPKKIEAWAPGQ